MGLKTLELTQGQVAVIDDTDFDNLKAFNWFAVKDRDRWYAATSIVRDDGKRQLLRMHRFVADAPAEMQVDHINGNGLDNRRSNLRVCTHQENQWNRQAAPRNSTTGLQGVNYNKANKNFRAAIKHNKKSIHLGVFSTKEAAFEAYKAASIKFKGEFSPYHRQGR